jgi:hypothetical protein
MRAVTVYRLDYDSNTGYRARHPIGAVLELRNHERVDNNNALLRMARRLFALDAADAVRIVIDVDPAPVVIDGARQEPHSPEGWRNTQRRSR